MAFLGSAPWRAGLVLSVAFMASGCTASNYIKAAQETRPKSAFAACEYLALALKADPQNQEAIALLTDIAAKVAEEHANTVKGLANAGRYSDAVAQCDRMIALRKLVTECPGNIDVFHAADERSNFAKKAADKYLTDGKGFSANGNPKKAAQCFCVAKGFDPSNAEAQRLYDESKSAATLRLAVPKFTSQTDAGNAIATDVTNRFFDKVVEKKPQFLALSQEGEGQAQAVLVGNVGCVWKDSGWIEKPGHHKERRQRPVVDGAGNPRLDAQGNQLYEDYVAEVVWVLHERATSLDLSIGYQVKLQDGTVKWAKEVADRTGDARKWVSDVRGDKGILPSDVSDLPRDPVAPRDFGASAGTIVDQMCGKLAHELYLQQKK
jgi:hypothetical protein